MIKLSIIIPHYNSIHSLSNLLCTIPKLNEIEVIIVDDRSNLNGLEKIILDSKIPNICLSHNNKETKGAGTCRNIGIDHAKGDWILFADSDDLFVEGFYDIVHQYFYTDNDVIFFVPTSIEIDSKKLSNRHKIYEKLINDYILKQDWKAITSLKYQYYVPWSKLISRNFLLKYKIRFDEIIASNDIMFSAKVGHYMNSFDVSDKVIYCVTKNKGSLTVNKSIEVFNARLNAYISYCTFLKNYLTKKQLKHLDLKGTGFVINVIRYGLGLKMLFSTISKLRKGKIKIVDLRFINPVFVIKKIVNHIKIHKYNKKYYS